MTRIEVHHVRDLVAVGGHSLLGEIGWGSVPIDFPRNHELVAVVSVASAGMEAVDDAYRLTNNIDESWLKNVEVEFKGTASGCRSTHIGDVLVLDGVAYVCAPFGWQEVVSLDQKVVRG